MERPTLEDIPRALKHTVSQVCQACVKTLRMPEFKSYDALQAGQAVHGERPQGAPHL